MNVVVIMMDDLAWGDLACHGNPFVRTPVLDDLHGRSTRFTRYLSGPMCTPARASLMTGRYHQRPTGAMTNASRRRSMFSRRSPCSPEQSCHPGSRSTASTCSATGASETCSCSGFAAPRIVIGSPNADPVLLTRQDWRIDGGAGDMGEVAGWLGTTRGWWDVEVEGARHRFDVEVLLEPFTWGHPAFFRAVHLSVDGVERTVRWVLQCTRYEFRGVELPEGPVRIEAWADQGDTRQSALYVEVFRA